MFHVHVIRAREKKLLKKFEQYFIKFSHAPHIRALRRLLGYKVFCLFTYKILSFKLHERFVDKHEL